MEEARSTTNKTQTALHILTFDEDLAMMNSTPKTRSKLPNLFT
jgi:hypothetical protein